jgi:hypothetical protein
LVSASRCQPERGVQSESLGPWQLINATLYRSEQLMQRRERELRLRFDPAGAQQSEATRVSGGILQER